MVENSNATTNRKLLMGMVSAAVLYDRITDSGVFSKRSGVGVSPVVQIVTKVTRYILRTMFMMSLFLSHLLAPLLEWDLLYYSGHS